MVLAYLAFKSCRIKAVLDSFRPILDTIGELDKFSVRCVRFGSAFFGCMVLSMCADMPLSAPFAFSKCNTAYPIRLLRFIRLTFRFVRFSLLFVFGYCRRFWQGVQRGATPSAYWGFSALTYLGFSFG